MKHGLRVLFGAGLGEDLLEGFHQYRLVDTSGHIGVFIGPSLSLSERCKLSDYQAATEAGIAGIFAVDAGVGSREQKSALIL